jgi:hypothetical protein
MSPIVQAAVPYGSLWEPSLIAFICPIGIRNRRPLNRRADLILFFHMA